MKERHQGSVAASAAASLECIPENRNHRPYSQDLEHSKTVLLRDLRALWRIQPLRQGLELFPLRKHRGPAGRRSTDATVLLLYVGPALDEQLDGVPLAEEGGPVQRRAVVRFAVDGRPEVEKQRDGRKLVVASRICKRLGEDLGPVPYEVPFALRVVVIAGLVVHRAWVQYAAINELSDAVVETEARGHAQRQRDLCPFSQHPRQTTSAVASGQRHRERR